MKTKSVLKKIVLFSISLITFAGALVCSIYSGAFFQNNPSQAFNKLINEECELQERGSAIYGTIGYEYSDINVAKINSMKKDFDELLNNQLSKAEFNVSVSALGKSFKNLTIMETESYDRTYDTMHMYSNTTWYYFDAEQDSAYISTSFEQKLIEGTTYNNASGIEILISINGISKAVTISGTYETNIYPKRKGFAARSDGLISAFGETILLHENTLLDFSPTKAVSMFSIDSSNNGQKFKDLKSRAIQNGFSFEFNVDLLPDSSLDENINAVENYYYQGSRAGAAVGFLFGSLALTVSFFVFFHKSLILIKLQDDKTKRNNILTATLFLSVISVSVIVLFVLKSFPLVISPYIKISMLNFLSMLIFSFIVLSVIVFLLIKQKRTILQILKEREDNSEFNY